MTHKLDYFFTESTNNARTDFQRIRQKERKNSLLESENRINIHVFINKRGKRRKKNKGSTLNEGEKAKTVQQDLPNKNCEICEGNLNKGPKI